MAVGGEDITVDFPKIGAHVIMSFFSAGKRRVPDKAISYPGYNLFAHRNNKRY